MPSSNSQRPRDLQIPSSKSQPPNKLQAPMGKGGNGERQAPRSCRLGFGAHWSLFGGCDLGVGASRRPSAAWSFTLIELLVVISVIAILAGMLLAAIKTGGTSGRIQTTRALISQVGMAVTQYEDAWGSWPNWTADAKSWPTSCMLWRDLVAYNTGMNRAPYLVVKDTFKLDSGQTWSHPISSKTIPLYVLIDGFAQPMLYDPAQFDKSTPPVLAYFPAHNPKTYDFFSAGAYASQITNLGGKLPGSIQDFETAALGRTSDGNAYTYEQYTVSGNTVNKYIGNW